MKKHGHSLNDSCRSGAYRSWEAMKYRCDSKKAIQFKDYGGRGIKYCDEWKFFANFLADMGDRPVNKTLDRIDNNKNYYKENCRWADSTTQRNNRRDVIYYDYNGSKYTLKELSDLSGKTIFLIRQRIIRDGMSVFDAVNKPSRIKPKMTAAQARIEVIRSEEASNRFIDKVTQ